MSTSPVSNLNTSAMGSVSVVSSCEPWQLRGGFTSFPSRLRAHSLQQISSVVSLQLIRAGECGKKKKKILKVSSNWAGFQAWLLISSHNQELWVNFFEGFHVKNLIHGSLCPSAHSSAPESKTDQFLSYLVCWRSCIFFRTKSLVGLGLSRPASLFKSPVVCHLMTSPRHSLNPFLQMQDYFPGSLACKPRLFSLGGTLRCSLALTV